MDVVNNRWIGCSAYDEDVLTLEAGNVLVGTLDTVGDFALVLVAWVGQYGVRQGSSNATYIVARS